MQSTIIFSQLHEIFIKILYHLKYLNWDNTALLATHHNFYDTQEGGVDMLRVLHYFTTSIQNTYVNELYRFMSYPD